MKNPGGMTWTPGHDEEGKKDEPESKSEGKGFLHTLIWGPEKEKDPGTPHNEDPGAVHPGSDYSDN